MNTTEFKKLAEAATQGEWLAEGHTVYSLMHFGWRKGEEQFKNRFWMPVYKDAECPEEERQANVNFVKAANPAAILKLLAINAELVEALKACMTGCEFRSIGGDSPAWHQKQMPSNEALNKARAALAKAEGGEL